MENQPANNIGSDRNSIKVGCWRCRKENGRGNLRGADFLMALSIVARLGSQLHGRGVANELNVGHVSGRVGDSFVRDGVRQQAESWRSVVACKVSWT